MSLADPPVPRCFDEVGTFWFGLGFLMGEGSYRNDSVIYPFSFPPRNGTHFMMVWMMHHCVVIFHSKATVEDQ